MDEFVEEQRRANRRVEIRDCFSASSTTRSTTIYGDSDRVQSLFAQIAMLFRNHPAHEVLMGSQSAFLNSSDREWLLSSASGFVGFAWGRQSDYSIVIRTIPTFRDVTVLDNHGYFVQGMFIRRQS